MFVFRCVVDKTLGFVEKRVHTGMIAFRCAVDKTTAWFCRKEAPHWYVRVEVCGG